MAFGSYFGGSIGMLLLAIYLILIGITGFSGNLGLSPVIYNVLALLAGIFLLIGR